MSTSTRRIKKPPIDAQNVSDWVWKKWFEDLYLFLATVTPGAGAPVDAEYVTLANDSTLTNERVLAAGTGITIVDGGANNTVTISSTATGGGLDDTLFWMYYEGFNNQFLDPSTTKGDLITRDSSTLVRLGVGTDGQVLVADSTQSAGIKWGSAGATTVSNSDGTLTISPTSGAVVASLNLAHANTWTGQQTFNTSAPIFGTMTAGSVFFAGTSGLLSQDNTNFFWDNTNKWLGIGVNAKVGSERLQVKNSTVEIYIFSSGTGTTDYAALRFRNSDATSTENYVSLAGGSYTVNGVFEANSVNLASHKGHVNLICHSAKDIRLSTGGSTATNIRGVISSTGQFGVFMDGLTATIAEDVHFKANHNSRHSVTSENANGTAGYAQFGLTIAGTEQGGMSTTGSSWTPSGAFLASQTNFFGYASGGVNIISSAGIMRFLTNGTATTNERMRLETNGDIKFFNAGTQKFHWDMVNSRFNFLEATTTAGNDFFFAKTQNATTSAYFQNPSTGTAGRSTIGCYNSANAISFFKYSTGYTTSGLEVASLGLVYNGSGPTVICSGAASTDIIFAVGGLAAANEAFRIDSLKNVSLGTAALGTTATDGFLYIPTCAGAPTGVPTAKTGRVPIVYDTTNNNFYAYNGAWKKVTLT